MADNVEIQGIEFQIKENSDSAVASLEKLQNTLVRLKTATSGGVSALRTTARQLDSLNKALENTSADKIQKIRSLTSGLKSLSEVSAVKISSSVPNQIAALSTALSQIKTTDGDKLIALANGMRPLSELGRSRLTSFISQLGKLPEVMHELDAADLDKFNRQMKELAAAIRPLSDEMQRLGTGFAALPARLQRAITMVNQYNTAVQRGTRRTSMFSRATGMIRFGILYAGLRRVVGLIGTAITESNTYQEDLNLFSVALGKYAKEAQNYAEKVSSVMGIDPAQWMRNQGVFQTLLTGFGDTEDRAYTMSKNLTQLGYDLSSFFNISVEDSMQKLQSGIAGELEPLRRLGYDLSVARLQQEALNLGITKSVSAMNQAEKAELRYYAIMTQVTTAQGDMARTLEAPANQLRVLRAEITQVSRAIGNLFIPILTKVLPYVIAFLQIVRELANALAKLFRFELTDVDWDGVNRGAVAAGELSNNMDAAVDAAKEFKRYTMGFDELNILPSNTGSSGKTDAGITGSGGLGINLPEYDFLAGAVSRNVEQVKTKIKELLPLAIAVGAAFSGWSIAKGILPAITAISKKLATLIPMAGTIGTGMLAAGVGMIIAGLPTYLVSVYDAIKNGLNWLNGVLIPLGSTMAGAGVGAIIGSIGGPIGMGIGALIGLAVGALTDLAIWIVQNFGNEIAGFFTSIWEWFDGKIIQPVVSALSTAANWVWENVISPIIKFFRPVAESVADVATHIWNNAVEIVSGIIEGVKTIWNKIKETSLKVMEVLAAVGTAFYTYVIVPVTGWVKEHVVEPLKKAGTWVYDTVIKPIVGFFLAKLTLIRDTAVKIFKGIWTTVSDFASGIFKGVINGIFSTIERTINGFIRMLNLAIGLINKIPGVSIAKVEPIYIPKLAEGGFPNEGQLFVAREAGAEMVGNIGRRTAVANNDQIVSAVSDGVYRAVMSAMSNKDGVSGDINLTINMDGDVVYRNVVKKNKEAVRATGKSPLFA